MFSCEFCKISKNTFFYRTHLAGASEVSFYNLKKKPQQNSVCISFNWQMRGTSSDNEWYSEWYNEWQQVTMNDNKWYNKWQWVVQWMTTNGKEWQQVTKNDNKWPFHYLVSLVNISKKGKNLFVPSLQYCQFGQDGWKSRTFFMKISWRWTCSQIFRKFRRLENLRLFWMMLNTAFTHL